MPLVEISVDSSDSALAAEQGGADRIELCSALREGGITPSLGLLRVVRASCSIPIFAIVRPRGGDFLYSDSEFRTMKEDIHILTEEGVQGVVLGVLEASGCVDKVRTRALVELAGTMSVTFHRAFDMVADLEASLEDVIECGAHRVLTSGGAPTAWQGREMLRRLVHQAGGRAIIVAGGGVRPESVGQLVESTRALEYHSSMRSVARSGMEHQVRHMSLGEPAADEFSRPVVLAADVQKLMQATQEPDALTLGTLRVGDEGEFAAGGRVR